MANGKLFKVSKFVVDQNMKFWGGDKVPYLRSTVNVLMGFFADPKKVIDEWKFKPSVQSRIKSSQTKIEKATTEFNAENAKMNQMISTYLQQHNDMYHQVLSLERSYPKPFNTTVVYKVADYLLNKCNLNNTINKVEYYGLAKDVTPIHGKNYLTAVKTLKKTERELADQLSKVNSAKFKIKTAQSDMENTVKFARTEKDKK